MAERTTADGFLYWNTEAELTDSANDAKRASNVNTKWAEVRTTADQAKTDATQAKLNAAGAAAAAQRVEADLSRAVTDASTAKTQSSQAVTTANAARTTAIAAEAVARDELQPQVDALNTAAGYAPGDATDAAMANVGSNPDTQFRAVLKAQTAVSFTQMKNRPVNLNDPQYAVDFTHATDSTVALQQAINDAGPGGRVEFGRPGRIRVASGTLQMLPDQTIDGGTWKVGKYQVDPNAQLSFLNHTGTQVGIQMGETSRIENISLRGPGNAGGGIGVKNDAAAASGPAHSARFKDVSFIGWGTGVRLDDCYYGYFDGCEFAINAVGVDLYACNNIVFQNPRILAQSNWDGGTGGIGIRTNAISSLDVFGGSIEMFGAGGGIQYGSHVNINVIGTYWETHFQGAMGVTTTATRTNATINLWGNYVFLDYVGQWLRLDASNSALNSKGNRFASTKGSPIAYIVNPGNLAATNGNSVDLSGDSWSLNSPTAVYVDAVAKNAPNYRVAAPRAAGDGEREFTGRQMVLPASTTARASMRIPAGVLPTSLAEGDMWSDGTALYVRMGGLNRKIAFQA